MSRSLRVEFASKEWFALAGNIAQRLVESLGVSGTKFSLCETFTNAPLEIASSGTASWHLVVDCGSARAGLGGVESPDLRVEAPYDWARDEARRIYTPELLTDRAEHPEKYDFGAVVSGDPARAPTELLLELHNELATRTK